MTPRLTLACQPMRTEPRCLPPHRARGLLLLGMLSACGAPRAETGGLSLRLEYGAGRVVENSIQRPATADGDRFSVNTLTRDRLGLGRVELRGTLDRWQEGGEWRLAFVPFRQTGTRVPPQAFRYDRQAFATSAPVTTRYQFDSYRLTYSVPAGPRGPRGELRLGATLAVRDAETRFTQASTRARFDNVGVVPLLYARARWTGLRPWLAELEFEGLPGPGGAALYDIKAAFGRNLGPRAMVEIGGRYLAGRVNGGDFSNTLVTFGPFAAVSARF